MNKVKNIFVISLLICFLFQNNGYSQKRDSLGYSQHSLDFGLGLTNKAHLSFHLRYHFNLYKGFQIGSFINYESPINSSLFRRRSPFVSTRDFGILASKEFITSNKASIRISTGVSYLAGTGRGQYLFYDDSFRTIHYYEKINFKFSFGSASGVMRIGTSYGKKAVDTYSRRAACSTGGIKLQGSACRVPPILQQGTG